MQRIQKISTVFVYFITFLLITLPLLHITLWYFWDCSFLTKFIAEKGWSIKTNFSGMVATPEGDVNLADVKWTPLSKAINIFADIVANASLYLGLLLLRKIFLAYQQGEVFAVKTVGYYRYLGYLFFLDAVALKPLSNLLEILSVTLSNPPGHRYISLYFGTPNVEQLFWGGIVIVISWIMLEASKLYEDQQLTV